MSVTHCHLDVDRTINNHKQSKHDRFHRLSAKYKSMFEMFNGLSPSKLVDDGKHDETTVTGLAPDERL